MLALPGLVMLLRSLRGGGRRCCAPMLPRRHCAPCWRQTGPCEPLRQPTGSLGTKQPRLWGWWRLCTGRGLLSPSGAAAWTGKQPGSRQAMSQTCCAAFFLMALGRVCWCRRPILPTTMAAGAPRMASLLTAELHATLRAAAPACRSWPPCLLLSRSASRAGWALPTSWTCSTPSWPMSCGFSTQTRMRCLPKTAWHCLVEGLEPMGACFSHSKLLAATACLGGGWD